MEDDWVNKVLAIPIPTNGKTDRFYWDGTTTGEYSVKSGYHTALQQMFEEKGTAKDRARRKEFQDEGKRCGIWRLPGPAKWRILLWKILTDTLPLGSEFTHRGIRVSGQCQLCREEDILETQEHLFRDCPITARFWASTKLGIRSGMGREVRLKTWIANWLALLAKQDATNDTTILFMAALWSIWCFRNDLIFRHSEISFAKVINHYRDSVMTAKASHKMEYIRKKSMRKTWVAGPRQEEFERLRSYLPLEMVGSGETCHPVRIKVDAAWNKDGISAYGWVCINEGGETLFEGSVKGRAQSPLQAETMAIREVLTWARENRILHVWINSDCLVAITQLAELSAHHHHCQYILQDVSRLSAFFHCCMFSFIPRALNRRAHSLAQRAKLL